MTTRGCTEQDFKTIGSPAFITRSCQLVLQRTVSGLSRKFACNRHKRSGQEDHDFA